MRSPLRTSPHDATRAPAQELVIPRGRCPVPTHTNLHTRRIPVAAYIAALLLLPTLIVGGFISAGLWASAENSTTAQGAQAGTTSGSGEGGADLEAPATATDVKGSMTVKQVVDAFPPITAAQILARLGAPLDTPASAQLKTLVEKGNSIDVPTLRTWLEEQGTK
jgi:hypothetical protein